MEKDDNILTFSMIQQIGFCRTIQTLLTLNLSQLTSSQTVATYKYISGVQAIELFCALLASGESKTNINSEAMPHNYQFIHIGNDLYIMSLTSTT